MPPTLLDVTDLACRRGGRIVFERLSFGLAAGELLALTGRNGSGKTTLLRSLALLMRPAAGRIAWQGADVADDPEGWRARLAWLGHLDGLKGDLTVRENLVAAARLRGGAVDTAAIEASLAAFDLLPLANRPARTLSAGQRRRTALARVRASGAPLWLLDEPLNALDAAAQQALRDVLRQHLAAGGLALASTHVNLGLDGSRRLELGA